MKNKTDDQEIPANRLAAWDRALLRTFFTSLIKRVSEAPPVYVAQFALPDGGSLPEIHAQRWPGLLSTHVVESQTGDRHLVSYWYCLDSYRAESPELIRLLDTDEAITEGYAHNTYWQRTPTWKQPKFWWQLLVHLVALIGMVGVIEKTTGALITAPNVTTDVTTQQPIPLLEQAPFEVRLQLINRSKTATATILLNNVQLTDSTGKPVQSNLKWQQAPIILRTGTAEIPILGTTPPKGKYRIRINGTAEAGKLRKAQQLTHDITLKVWPPLQWSGLEIELIKGKKCHMRGTITAGQKLSHNRFLQASLRGYEGVQFVSVVGFPHVQRSNKHYVGTPGAEVALIQWPLRNLLPFKTYNFSIYLTGNDSTDWHQVAKDIEIQQFSSNIGGDINNASSTN